MTHVAPTDTPNVVVSNPRVRKVANIVLGTAGLVLGTAIVVDGASAGFDITAYTGPILAGYVYLASAFQIAVTVPNIPTR